MIGTIQAIILTILNIRLKDAIFKILLEGFSKRMINYKKPNNALLNFLKSGNNILFIAMFTPKMILNCRAGYLAWSRSTFSFMWGNVILINVSQDKNRVIHRRRSMILFKISKSKLGSWTKTWIIQFMTKNQFILYTIKYQVI